MLNILEIKDHNLALEDKRWQKLLQELKQSENIERFPGWTKRDYIKRGTKLIFPMLASPTPDDKVADYLENEDYVAQHKLDGERCTLHISKEYNRLFSRRISDKTDWLNEKTDLLPHLRDLNLAKFFGTVLDGELIHPSGEFKKVGSVLRSLPQRAWDKQKTEGFLFYVVYDITHYKGISVKHRPYRERLRLLQHVVYDHGNLRSPFIIPIITVHKGIMLDGKWLTKEAYLKYILEQGGEGVIMKDLSAPYEEGVDDKRSKYLRKIKEVDTWDVVITGYDTELQEYTGKEIENAEGVWHYWYDPNNKKKINNTKGVTSGAMLSKGLIPITRYFYNDWIRAVKFGVCVPLHTKLTEALSKSPVTAYDKKHKNVIIEIGQTSGMSDEIRQILSENMEKYKFHVIEVMANGITDVETAALRHPRFVRFREDKTPDQCTLKSHLRIEADIQDYSQISNYFSK